MKMKELMREEALKRMKFLNMHENVISEFKREGKLNKTVTKGILYWLSEEEMEMVKAWEEETGNVVFHVMENKFEFGHCYSFLYISKYQEEWEMDMELMKDNICYAYVKNVDDEICSEYGTVGILPIFGGVIRVA